MAARPGSPRAAAIDSAGTREGRQQRARIHLGNHRSIWEETLPGLTPAGRPECTAEVDQCTSPAASPSIPPAADAWSHRRQCPPLSVCIDRIVTAIHESGPVSVGRAGAGPRPDRRDDVRGRLGGRVARDRGGEERRVPRPRAVRGARDPGRARRHRRQGDRCDPHRGSTPS